MLRGCRLGILFGWCPGLVWTRRPSKRVYLWPNRWDCPRHVDLELLAIQPELLASRPELLASRPESQLGQHTQLRGDHHEDQVLEGCTGRWVAGLGRLRYRSVVN